jgi:8-oxo-dGTP pyrophosphatase MutT (NUDIX family)
MPEAVRGIAVIWSVVPVSIPANPRPASTVVVLRDSPRGPEAFMVRRHEATAFMGGAHVFPGGRVDAADRDADVTWCDGLVEAEHQLPALPPAEARAYHVAAARELFEEAGVLLARAANGRFVSIAGTEAHERFKAYRTEVHAAAASLRAIVQRERLRLALDALVLFAHWVTPPIDTRQFDTRFFLTRVPPEQTPAHDETETTHSVWLTPAAAIREAEAGAIVLPPPTWTTLRELERFETVDAALAWGRERRVERREPAVLERDGRRMLLLPGDPLHPDAPAGERPLETRFVFVERGWRAERAPT